MIKSEFLALAVAVAAKVGARQQRQPTALDPNSMRAF